MIFLHSNRRRIFTLTPLDLNRYFSPRQSLTLSVEVAIDPWPWVASWWRSVLFSPVVFHSCCRRKGSRHRIRRSRPNWTSRWGRSPRRVWSRTTEEGESRRVDWSVLANGWRVCEDRDWDWSDQWPRFDDHNEDIDDRDSRLKHCEYLSGQATIVDLLPEKASLSYNHHRNWSCNKVRSLHLDTLVCTMDRGDHPEVVRRRSLSRASSILCRRRICLVDPREKVSFRFSPQTIP